MAWQQQLGGDHQHQHTLSSASHSVRASSHWALIQRTSCSRSPPSCTLSGCRGCWSSLLYQACL